MAWFTEEEIREIRENERIRDEKWRLEKQQALADSMRLYGGVIMAKGNPTGVAITTQEHCENPWVVGVGYFVTPEDIKDAGFKMRCRKVGEHLDRGNDWEYVVTPTMQWLWNKHTEGVQ
jgi:hypothetical protein